MADDNGVSALEPENLKPASAIAAENYKPNLDKRMYNMLKTQNVDETTAQQIADKNNTAQQRTALLDALPVALVTDAQQMLLASTIEHQEAAKANQAAAKAHEAELAKLKGQAEGTVRVVNGMQPIIAAQGDQITQNAGDIATNTKADAGRASVQAVTDGAQNLSLAGLAGGLFVAAKGIAANTVNTKNLTDLVHKNAGTTTEEFKELREADKGLDDKIRKVKKSDERQDVRLADHAGVLHNHADIITDGVKRLDNHADVLVNHADGIDDAKRRLNEQKNTLDDHKAVLNNHADGLDNHENRLGKVETQRLTDKQIAERQIEAFDAVTKARSDLVTLGIGPDRFTEPKMTQDLNYVALQQEAARNAAAGNGKWATINYDIPETFQINKVEVKTECKLVDGQYKLVSMRVETPTDGLVAFNKLNENQTFILDKGDSVSVDPKTFHPNQVITAQQGKGDDRGQILIETHGIEPVVTQKDGVMIVTIGDKSTSLVGFKASEVKFTKENKPGMKEARMETAETVMTRHEAGVKTEALKEATQNLIKSFDTDGVQGLSAKEEAALRAKVDSMDAKHPVAIEVKAYVQEQLKKAGVEVHLSDANAVQPNGPMQVASTGAASTRNTGQSA